VAHTDTAGLHFTKAVLRIIDDYPGGFTWKLTSKTIKGQAQNIKWQDHDNYSW